MTLRLRAEDDGSTVTLPIYDFYIMMILLQSSFNRLNALQAEIFTQFPLKGFAPNFLRISGVCPEITSDSKICIFIG